MALDFGNKVENGGIPPNGVLPASEFNQLVAQVNKNEEDIAAIDTPNSIESIEATESQESGGNNVITITETNGTETSFNVKNGNDGANGVSLGDVEIADNLTTDDATKVLSAKQGKKLNDITPKVSSNPNADLDIMDDDGNVLARFGGGHLQTKNFNSADSPSIKTNLSTADLDVTDDDGNVLARFEDGHIKTKNFDSAHIQTSAFPNFSPVFAPTAYMPTYNASVPTLFGSLSDIYDAYDALATAHPQFFSRKTDIGMDASNTYQMAYYTLGWQSPKVSMNRDGSGTNLWSDATYKPTRLLICSGVHPTEKPSIYGCYTAIKAILESNEEWAQFIRNNLILDIVPVLNPWGVVNNSDNNVNGKNLNRTYFNDQQAENLNLIALITDLQGKGLKGGIDCHNDYGDNDGYFVGKPSYPFWNYYVLLTQRLSALMNYLFEDIYGTTKNHFHTWDATGNNGQLHHYLNSLGLLGCTFEVRFDYNAGNGIYAQMTQALLVNMINAFSTYNNI